MTVPSDDLDVRLELARELVVAAGDLTLRYFRRADLVVEHKSDASPVTAADREAEQLLRTRIAEAFPNDGVLGEEFPETEGRSGWRWIVDPVDGTKSFIAGVPLFGTLIGVEHQGECLIGAVRMPALGETLYAATGRGAWHVLDDAAPVPAEVSTTAALADGLFCTTAIESFSVRPEGRALFDALADAAGITRTWGDCYGYVLVATGRAELMVDPVMNAWDAAPMVAILREAGGTFTDFEGRSTIESGEGIATNGRLLDEVLAITRGR